ncbi:MAG: bifunctional UDP-sugar hydrolase/5'-nucleotidase [Elusimicrobiota bacterium]
MNSRGFRLILILALAVAPRAARAAAPDTIRIRVYHTNDIHGWIMSRPDKNQPERLVGGAAALASLIGQETGPKLVLDAGDWWQGTPEGSLSKGEAVADIFNAIGYDALVVGNHEYDSGAADLRALIGKIKAPVLSANTYTDDGKHAPWVKTWIIKEVAGVKVGIFGLTTTNMPRLAFPKNIEGLKFRREVDEGRDAVRQLKKAGAEVIIAVTHIGLEEEGKVPFEGDQTLAREVGGIDLVVGGHSHTTLLRPLRDARNGTLIVQAGCYLVRAGRATLTLDAKTHKVLAREDELVELRPERVGSDPSVQAFVARHQQAVGKLFETVIATAAAAMNREADRESGLGSWMADCYKDWAGVDAAFQNGGGIRADIPAGPMTPRTIFNVMPFDNALVKLQMKGAVLRDVLDHGAGMARINQIAGPSIVFRRGRPKGRRLVSAELGGAPIDDAKSYSVAALDFIVMGGDGFNAFSQADASEPTGVLAREVLRQCAERQKTVVAPPAGRMTLKED